MAKGKRGGKRITVGNWESTSNKVEWITDDEIVETLENEGFEMTNDPNDAIYVLRDGRMISGQIYYGVRGEDHRMIENLFNDIDRYDEKFWETAFERTGVLMLIPETRMALGLPSTKTGLTQKQINVLNRTRYKYEQIK